MMNIAGAKHFLILLAVSIALLSCEEKNDPASILLDKKVLFLGNSITQNGAYVSYIEYYLRKQYPEKNIDIISIGLSSETVSCLSEKDHPFPRPCLKERLARALEKVQPEVVVACYGMNDGIYHPQSPDRMKRFQDGIRDLLLQVDQVNATAILVTPPIFDALPIADKVVDSVIVDFGYARPYKDYDMVLEDYSRWLGTLAIPDVQVVDIHGPMKGWVAERRLQDPTFTFAADGIHPSPAGHLFMAHRFLENFGFSFDNNLSAEEDELRSDRLFQVVNERRKLRSDGWLRYVGYIKADTVRIASIEATELKADQLDREISILDE